MKRLIGVFLLGVVTVSVLSAGFARQSYAKVFTAEQIQQWQEEQLLEENAELFKQWRESIPDYEKRLYDRVKGINKRVIRVQNLVIGSFVLLLIFNGVFLTLINRRIGTGGTPNIIRSIGKFLSRVVIAPDETPASGSEDSNASLR